MISYPASFQSRSNPLGHAGPIKVLRRAIAGSAGSLYHLVATLDEDEAMSIFHDRISMQCIGAGDDRRNTVHRALARIDPAERAAFLDGACCGDAELRARLEA